MVERSVSTVCQVCVKNTGECPLNSPTVKEMVCCSCLALWVAVVTIAFFVARHYLEKWLLPRLEQRPVFITGCDTGFGHLLALQLAKHHIPVFAGCLTEKGAEELKKKAKSLNSGTIDTVTIDVTNQESVDKAYESVQKKLGGNKGLWAIVNNAGALGTNGPDDWLTVTDYKNIMELNAMGVIRVCQKFKSLVKKERGRVITVASIAGRVPFPSAGPYCVSKYACEGYMDVLRTELRVFGVSVHILEPGFFRNTGLLDINVIKSKQLELWNRQSNDVKREYGEQFFKDWQKAQVEIISDFGNPNPQLVADAYFHAITARFPRRRYAVGSDSKYFWIPLSMLPTRLQDFVFIILQKLRPPPKIAAVQ